MRCPICRKPVEADNPEIPFCSRRCRTIDLANWATGKYVISTPLRDPEAFGDAEAPDTDDESESDKSKH